MIDMVDTYVPSPEGPTSPHTANMMVVKVARPHTQTWRNFTYGRMFTNGFFKLIITLRLIIPFQLTEATPYSWLGYMVQYTNTKYPILSP